MPKFTADFHVHSKYSRATSKSCDLEGFYKTGTIKGLDVIGTGDFTHPAWFKELNDKLVQNASTGLYTLKDEYKTIEGRDISFILTAEISCIYKKNDRVRKIHSIIFAPNLEVASKINKRLDAIGNIKSDGRPILGLDVRNLLEIVLEASDEAYLVPAHIWTPWFSIFGDKSGFDTLEEAFDDLSGNIFALETGLSSDPEMNWRLSSLDRYTLISNSDCHSPGKLAREANLFDTDISYSAIHNALKTKEGFLGTLEFFPEEGKYHLDGHRACNISLEPEESVKLGNICPVCGKKLTIGTMHRVLELSDRPKGYRPDGAKDFISLIPLEEVISEIVGMGVASKAVKGVYESVIKTFESELFFLNSVSFSDIKSECGDVMAEAVKRMREGRVKTRAGFDGEYGRIFLFDQAEIESLKGQSGLFEDIFSKRKARKKSTTLKLEKPAVSHSGDEDSSATKGYTDEQEMIIEEAGNIRVISGPGTGKTHTLTGRIKHLVDGGAVPSCILVLTFTRKTKAELTNRINNLLGTCDVNVATFHSFGYDVLRQEGLLNRIIDEKEAVDIISVLSGKGKKEALKLYNQISLYRQCEKPERLYSSEIHDLLRKYIDYKNEHEIFDTDDLISVAKAFLKRKGDIPYRYIFIDEFQDINAGQFELVNVLFDHAKEVFAIGDFDQAVYSFRGADLTLFNKLGDVLPDLKTLSLSKTFRCPDNIISPSLNMIKNNIERYDYPLHSVSAERGGIFHYHARDEYDEADFVASKIKEFVGSYGLSEDTSKHDAKYSFSDFAVLARTNLILRKLAKAFDDKGIPYTILKEGEFESDAALALYEYFKALISGSANPQKLMFEDELSFAGNEFRPQELKGFLTKAFEENADIQAWEKDIFLESALETVSPDDFVYRISLALKNLVAHPKSQNVSLITLHASKGLEFKKVFIAGIDQGIIPYTLKEDTDMEEERRLFYVGLTRASEEVYLISSFKRLIYKGSTDFHASVFLKELGGISKVVRKKASKAFQLELFS